MAAQHLCAVSGLLFLYIDKTGQYDDYGEVGCTIVGTGDEDQDPVFRLGCYNKDNQYVCTTVISASNEAGANVALQGNYVSFRDDEGKTWSLQFESEYEALEFCGSVAVAMYGAAGQPADSVLVCDVAKGKGQRVALAHSLATVRFFGWVVEKKRNARFPSFGSRVEASRPELYSFEVPANHLSMLPDMKGFEGMLVGMHEKGRRFIVLPRAVRHDDGRPRMSLCFFVELIRVKVTNSSEDNGSPLAITAASANGGGVGGGRQQQPVHTGALVPTAAAGASSLSSSSPVLRAGFDRDQFMLVDRLRDQVFTLSEQLREARQQLQSFGADVRAHEQQRKPKSLLNAQIEHTVHRLLSDVDEQTERLAQRDETLSRMEEKNSKLQHSLDKLRETSNLLAEERKSNITARDEETLELDTQLAQVQTRLTRLSAETEDTLRNVNAMKRLLDQTGSDIKKEKSDLQIALVAFQTNESKLATAKDAYREETERCGLLESKTNLLAAELQTLQNDLEGKNRIIEECRRKTESDVLHYGQLLEDERRKAADELRGIRQELLEELGARDRRYQEERQRVAQDAYERGRVQGVDDGTAEAQLAADLKARELTLAAQRNTAETKAMEARIRVAREEKAADERRLGAEMDAAEGKLAAETSQCAALAREVDTLTQKRDAVTNKTFDALQEAIEGAKGPISQRLLLRIIGVVQAGEVDVDYSLRTRESREDSRQQEQEKSEVEAWVRGVVYNQPATMPPMRPSCAVAAAMGIDEDTTTDDDRFFKLNDILRIREPSRKDTRPQPLSVLPPATTPPPLPHAKAPAVAVPTTSQPQPHQQEAVPAAAQSAPLFVAHHNPFTQPRQPPPPPPAQQQQQQQPSQPSASPAHADPQAPPQAPPQTQTQTQPSHSPPRQQVTFPPPQIRPLSDFGPPPSLGE